MSKTDTNAETAVAETASNRKREITAVVASTAVTVVLSTVASVLANKVGMMVHDRINHKPENDE